MIEAGATREEVFESVVRETRADLLRGGDGMSTSSQSRARAGAPGQPSEEELRAAYEEQLRRITTADLIVQTAVSLLNLGARRLARRSSRRGAEAGERDLEQVRDAIDGARGAAADPRAQRCPQELAPLRDALSQLQMAYAREAGAGRRRRPAPASRRRGRRRAAARAARAPAAAAAPASAARQAIRPGPGASERAALGARPLSAAPAPLGARRCAGRTLAGRHDRLRPRLHRVDARAERSGPANVRATILARHANQTAEDFC